MSLFGLSSDDLQDKVQPVAGDQTFLIGAAGDLSVAKAEEIIEAAEDRVLMRLDHRYRQLLRRVDGEIVVGRALGGETTVVASLKPVKAGSMIVWKNFGSAGLWLDRDRRKALASSEWSIDEATGLVTLNAPLKSGDSIWLEYDHEGASAATGLREMALTLAAVEVSHRFAFFRDAEDDSDRFENWKADVYTDLNNLKCVDVLDRLKLVGSDTEPDDFYRRVLMLERE